MQFTVSWLKEYLNTEATTEEIAEKLTSVGLEVEKITDPSKGLSEFTVARILETKPHPNAARLRCCKVDTGSEILDIVCGAPNARKDINVVLAPVGSTIPNSNIKIKASEIRGEKSNGMLCSAKELNLGEDHDGIIEMPLSEENIGKKFTDITTEGMQFDPVIEIAITPNRGDCLGVYGIARDLAATDLGTLKALPEIEKTEALFKNPFAVNISSPKTAPVFSGCCIKNVKNGESPEWLKKRLKSIGQNSVSTLVDITVFLTFSFGRPAHVYDLKKLKGNLDIRMAQENEKFKALNGKEYILSKEMTVISDEEKIISLAGIIGSENSCCDEDTTDIFIEIALFDPVSTANTGRKLELTTDARYRFERGTDPKFIDYALDFSIDMIKKYCGGEVGEKIITDNLNYKERIIDFDFKKVKDITGVDIPDKEISSILENLGFKISGNKVTVASWRPDIEKPVDLVEEVIRIYGYDNITASPLPDISQSFKNETNNDRDNISLAFLMASRRLTETVTWSFMNEKKAKLFSPENSNLKLKNPINSDLDYMRPSILPNLIDAVKRNSDRGFRNLSLFEIGPVFSNKNELLQESCVTAIRTGKTTEKDFFKSSRDFDLFDLRADLFFVINKLGFPDESLNISRTAPSYYHPSRSAAVKIGKNILGYYGEIHPSITEFFGIDFPVCGFEFFLDALPDSKKKKNFKKKIAFRSDYQKSVRDFAFIVPRELEVRTLLQTVKNCNKQLIQDIKLFDIYRGENIDPDLQSVAISVIIQSKDHTLTEKELEEVNNKITDSVAKNCNGKLRQ